MKKLILLTLLCFFSFEGFCAFGEFPSCKGPLENKIILQGTIEAVKTAGKNYVLITPLAPSEGDDEKPMLPTLVEEKNLDYKYFWLPCLRAFGNALAIHFRWDLDNQEVSEIRLIGSIKKVISRGGSFFGFILHPFSRDGIYFGKKTFDGEGLPKEGSFVSFRYVLTDHRPFALRVNEVVQEVVMQEEVAVRKTCFDRQRSLFRSQTNQKESSGDRAWDGHIDFDFKF